MIPSISHQALAAHAACVADALARPAAERTQASARLVSPLVIEKLAPEVGGAVAVSGAAKTKSTKKTSSAGYAKTTSAKKTPDPLAFLKDKKLSVEQKLMRLLAHLNAQYEKQMEEKMKLLAGEEPAATKGSTSSTGTTSKPKSSFLSSAVGALKKLLPAAGIATSLLGTKGVQTLLGKIGGPVLAAAASAMGFPALAPALLKLGPAIVDVAVDAAKALDAAALDRGPLGAGPDPSGGGATASGGGSMAFLATSSAATTTSSSGATSSSTTKKALSDGEQRLQLMELQRLQDHQKEMFQAVSNLLKAGHDTRSAIIGNIR